MSIRIEDKQNVFLNGDEVTGFKVFEKDGDRYIFAGQFFASGHDASDHQCQSAFAEADDFGFEEVR